MLRHRSAAARRLDVDAMEPCLMEQQDGGDKALVSIIIPTYNRRYFLEQAIESCFSQTYPEIEVIVVDDGSNDDTALYLAALGTSHPPERFRFRKQPNQGPSAARNAGLELARGEYVKFLDSDDSLDRKAISGYVAAIQRHDADLCIGSRRYMSPDGKPYSVNYSPTESVIDRPLLRFFRLELKPQGAFWMFKRKIFDAVHWNEALLAREDTDLLVRILLRPVVVCGAPEAIYSQRCHQLGRQMEKQFDDSVMEAILQSSEQQLDLMLANGVDLGTRRAFASSMCRTSLRLWTSNKASAKRLVLIAKNSVLLPELVLSKSYPLVLRILAYGLWVLGGLKLCGPLWGLYGYIRAKKTLIAQHS
jgi:glycosyl transferase family 2